MVRYVYFVYILSIFTRSKRYKKRLSCFGMRFAIKTKYVSIKNKDQCLIKEEKIKLLQCNVYMGFIFWFKIISLFSEMFVGMTNFKLIM